MVNQICVNTNTSCVELNKNNPYIPIDEEENSIQFYNIPQDLINRAIEIDKMTCGVRTVCLCDCFFNLYYLMFGYIYAIIFFTVSLGGYLSTVYYKKSLLCCYVIYQYFQVLGKIFLLSFWINMANDKNNHDITINIIICSFLVFFQCVISRFVHKYYYLLPSNEEIQRINMFNRDSFL